MAAAELVLCADGRYLPLLPRPFCDFCSKPLAEKYGSWGRCWWCANRLKELNAVGEPPQSRPYAFEKAGAAGLYVSDHKEKGQVGALVLQLKSSDAPIPALCNIMEFVLETRYPEFDPDALVPMPSAPTKPRHPAVPLARALGAALKTPVVEALALDGSYELRAGASERDKFNRCRDRFLISQQKSLAGSDVLLVDDVLTTVGCAHWAATKLLQSGVKSVRVIAAARTVNTGHLKFIGYDGAF